MQHTPSKRHLPIVKSAESDAAPATSVGLWVLYTCVIIISLWVPLAMLALLAGGRIGQWLAGLGGASSSSSPALLAPAAALLLVSFGIACSVGGLVLGRFSDRSRRGDAALAAGASIAVILVFAALGHALPSVTFSLVVTACLFALGAPCAVIGHGRGRRRSVAVPPTRDSQP